MNLIIDQSFKFFAFSIGYKFHILSTLCLHENFSSLSGDRFYAYFHYFCFRSCFVIIIYVSWYEVLWLY